MTPTSHTRLLFLTPPHHIALPALDRGQRAACHTLALARARWPVIMADVEGGKVESALAALERLARDMWESTASDPEPWRPTLELARRTVYANMRQLAAWCDQPTLAHEALTRCAAWDPLAEQVLQEAKTE